MKDIGKIAILGLGVGLLRLITKSKPVAGIGAAKRRIFKELSLAQKEGVDFTKKYDELSPSEIKALQKVSNDTGYTETYYKSLKKAYDAISGIGATYDVVDEEGNTVLTWVEDPGSSYGGYYSASDDAERYQALREAREIEDEIEWARTNKARELDEREARLAEQRKRLRKSGRSSQMSLFGCGYANTPNYSLSLLDRYLSTVPVFDAQVVLNDTNKQGHYYVLCGDSQGGRDFYISPKNLPYFREYCKKHNIEYDEFYLPDDALGYTPEVERELWEIWREQLEYGDTDFDFEDWKRRVGDEYLKKDVLPYM